MKLIFAHMFHKKMRTILTFLSIVITFLLFGLLLSINAYFERNVELSSAERIISTHKTSLIQMLPISYGNQIAQIEGVKTATHATWFGGQYKSPQNFFPKFAVEPKLFLTTYPEIQLSPKELSSWLSSRTGAIVGRNTAEKYGWKIGDKIQIEADIWPKATGENLWEFDLVGIFDGKSKGVDTTKFLFRYDYFDEARSHSKGMVGYYIISSNDSADNDPISQQIDNMYANSSAQTKTSSEAEYTKSLMKQIGDIGSSIKIILVAVIFTIILVTNNTITQSIRERTTAIAVMRTLGFSNSSIIRQIFSEAVILVSLGTICGMLLADFLLNSMENALLSIFNSVIILPVEAWVYSIILAIFISIVSGVPPAYTALRLKITDALAGDRV